MKPNETQKKNEKKSDKVVWKHGGYSYSPISSNSEKQDQDYKLDSTVWASIPALIKRTYNMAYTEQKKKKNNKRRQLLYREEIKLEIEQSQQISPHSMTTITYQKKGSQNYCKSTCRHLTQIKKICLNELKNQNVESDKVNEDIIRRRPRYFEEIQLNQQKADENPEEAEYIPVKRCYRCGIINHSARECRMSRSSQCNYCLGQHNISFCKDYVCSKCCEAGHSRRNCRKNEPYCQSCRKVGHLAKDCRRILLSQYPLHIHNPEVFEIDDQVIKNIKCFVCQKYGHFNCHKYREEIPQIYEE